MTPRPLIVQFTLIIVLLMAVASSPSAWASPEVKTLEQRLTPEQMHETGLDTLTAAQLARLNEILQKQEVVAKAAQEERVAQARGAGSFIGIDVKPITTRLKGSVSAWEPGTEFELENGQTWKVLKGSMKLRKPLQAPEVVLVPGIAGRWFLQIDEDAPKARVYRID
jgi:hypothetical protein